MSTKRGARPRASWATWSGWRRARPAGPWCYGRPWLLGPYCDPGWGPARACQTERARPAPPRTSPSRRFKATDPSPSQYSFAGAAFVDLWRQGKLTRATLVCGLATSQRPRGLLSGSFFRTLDHLLDCAAGPSGPRLCCRPAARAGPDLAGRFAPRPGKIWEQCDAMQRAVWGRFGSDGSGRGSDGYGCTTPPTRLQAPVVGR